MDLKILKLPCHGYFVFRREDISYGSGTITARVETANRVTHGHPEDIPIPVPQQQHT